MKFKINTGQLFNAYKPVADIALKNVPKRMDGKKCGHPRFVTLEALADTLQLKAYRGAASITVRITRKEGYVPEKSGAITVLAIDLFSSLKSFSPKDNLIVTAENKQVRFALESDKEVFIAVPAILKPIECPQIPRKFTDVAVVDRELFVKGLKRVAYAMAFDKTYLMYCCMLLETSNNKMRFSAGSGGRFAIIEFESDSQTVSSGETKMLFPRSNVSGIIRVFKDTPHPTVKVKCSDPSQSAETPQQIVIENDSIVMAIYDLKYFNCYPSLNGVLEHNYSYQISTNIEDWKYAVEAILATYGSHPYPVHNTKVTADFLHNHFCINPKTKMQMNKKIDFEPGTFVIDQSKSEDHKPWFCCNSVYIQEMVKHGCKKGVVVINFEDQTKLDNITDEKLKRLEPVLIKYPEKVDKNGIREKYFTFFTVSTVDYDRK